MNEETTAELQARLKKLETEIAALQAKGDDEKAKLELRAKLSEQREINQTIVNAQQAEKIVALEAADAKRKEEGAEAAVNAMVQSGAIAVRDTELQATYKAKFIADPSLIPLMAGKKPEGNTQQRVALNGTQGAAKSKEQVLEYGSIRAGALVVLKQVAALCAQQSKIQGMDPLARQQRGDLALQNAMIYQKEIRAARFDQDGLPMMSLDYINCPLEAATDQDTLGTLVGTLVTQRMEDSSVWCYDGH